MSKVANILEHSKAIPVPEPTFGNAIIKKVPVEKVGKIVVAAYVDPNADPGHASQQKYDRFRVVKAHKNYMLGITVMETEFGPGDYVCIAPGHECIEHVLELPSDHRSIRIADVRFVHPCPTESRDA